jgi:hypothetical protein
MAIPALERTSMRVITCTASAALVLIFAPVTSGQGTVRTLVAVWAHADDEGPVGPILARYAREGVQVHTIIATDGAQGAANTSVPRGNRIVYMLWSAAPVRSVILTHVHRSRLLPLV